VGNEQYLWAVARYIERNPLKAGLAERPEAFRWSSARAHLTEADDAVLGSPSWLTPTEKNAYSKFVLAEDEKMDEAIRKATRTGRPFGSEWFVGMLESQMQQTLRPNKVGRPRKEIGECPEWH
jgi:putative transposase